MKNTILSCFSSYSYTNSNNGCNEVFAETPSPINSNLFTNDNSLCFYGDFSGDHAHFDLQNTVDSILVTESTSTSHLNYMPVQEDIFYQPWSTIIQQCDNEIQLIQDARKRPAETSDAATCSLMNSGTNEMEREKKRPTRKSPKIHKEKEPTLRRRSQKLTDKITTLQKLVSPYGKTDTASVLLEASVSIQALQDQIEDMFRIISAEQTMNMSGERRSDLESRGLCLVPSVVLEELDRRLPPPIPAVNLYEENH